MSSSTMTSLAEPSAMSRRQPVRQTRTNPTRNVTTGRTLGGAQQEPPKAEIAPGFFPGISHFTDSITALPKEMIRHYTMLKEVDAKIYHPEEALKKLVGEALKGPPPVPATSSTRNDTQNAPETPLGIPGVTVEYTDMNDLDRLFDRGHRELHLQLRLMANSMLGTLDEKNHVIGNATDHLERLITRLESSWPAIENEISETTRIGSLDHWAYTNNAPTEKKASASESRPRREAANSNLAALANTAELERYDGRTVVSRKHRLAQGDSDFDEPRPGKRHVAGKGKKPEYTSAPNPSGLGITNGNPSKKRKIEKSTPTAGGHAMDRSASSLYGNNNRAGGSPRDTPTLEAAKKRSRASGAVLAAVGGGRKRAGTNNSTTNSPNLASSPVAGAFNPPQKAANSPALGAAMQRSGSTRARNNSGAVQPSKAPPPPPPPPPVAKETNGNGTSSATDTTNGAKTNETKGKTEEPANTELSTRSSGRATDRSTLKREESANSRHRPSQITTGTRNSGKASKTTTPVAATFPEATTRPPRSNRNTIVPTTGIEPPPKRSHKKGAGINAQAAAAAKAAAEAAKAAAEDGSDMADEMEATDGEPLYCYCQEVSYGEMIGCDGPNCKREWFHLKCVGLDKTPAKNETWFCKDCIPTAPKTSKR